MKRELRFSACIAHYKGLRNPLYKNPCHPSGNCNGLRLFDFELTNDDTRYPIDWVEFKGTGQPGCRLKEIGYLCKQLPEISQCDKETILDTVRKALYKLSNKLPVGENENFSISRPNNILLSGSTAEVTLSPNNHLTLWMKPDYTGNGNCPHTRCTDNFVK